MLKRKPIFLLGVGRCGSTSLQVHISRSSTAWIWGEHDGVLKGLFEWTAQVRESKGLESFSTLASRKDALISITDIGHGDATHVAWMNQFSSKQLENVERFAIESMCARRLPAGKKRWGFKEIRYGIDDKVPEDLLRLYPEAKFIHTVRHPYKTIESSIFAWHFDELEWNLSDGELSAIRGLYGTYASRWVQAVQYFHELRCKHPESVAFSRAESLADDFSGLMTFLGLEHDNYKVDASIAINSGDRMSDEANLVLREYLRTFRAEFRDTLAPAAVLAGYQI